MRRLKALLKLLAGVGYLLRGMWTIVTRFPKASLTERSQMIAHWAQTFLAMLGVRVQTLGQPVMQGPMLVVANHVSWLDILVLLAVQPVCFVSKSEVRHWPVIGWLATQVGTLYIERASRRDALRVVHQVAAALQAGQLIAVFPEGTTTDGHSVLPFHGNLLQAAISVGSPVQPVALRFVDEHTQQLSMSVTYVGDVSLMGSVWRLLISEPVQVQLHFLPVQNTTNEQDRRQLAQTLREQIVQKLGL